MSTLPTHWYQHHLGPDTANTNGVYHTTYADGKWVSAGDGPTPSYQTLYVSVNNAAGTSNGFAEIRPSQFACNWTAYGNSQWLANGSFYSSDAYSWTKDTQIPFGTPVYGGGGWSKGGEYLHRPATTNVIAGAWNSYTWPRSYYDLYDFDYVNGQHVAVFETFGTVRVYSSTNVISGATPTWTLRSSYSFNATTYPYDFVRSIEYAGGYYYIAGAQTLRRASSLAGPWSIVYAWKDLGTSGYMSSAFALASDGNSVVAVYNDFADFAPLVSVYTASSPSGPYTSTEVEHNYNVPFVAHIAYSEDTDEWQMVGRDSYLVDTYFGIQGHNNSAVWRSVPLKSNAYVGVPLEDYE